MRVRVLLLAALSLLLAAPAAAKTYRAERFDVHVNVRDDGSLHVTETIVFVFESGTFSTVFRTIPTRRTDGVEFESASMDGRELQQGKGPGHVRVLRKNGLRVEWHFASVSQSTHTFELSYIARGVVRQDPAGDELAWRALPREHAYRIGSSTVRFSLQAPPAEPIQVASRRVDGGVHSSIEATGVIVQASDIRRNGWIEPRMRFEHGALVASAPAWQRRETDQRAFAGVWWAVAAGVLLVGFIVLIGMRQSYDPPPPAAGVEWASVLPPDNLSPVLAGALVTNGQPRMEHAMAALVGLAERGVVSIQEEPRGSFGTRSFTITRNDGRHRLAPHEEAVLETIFKKARHPGRVSLSRARTQLTHYLGPFKKAVQAELHHEGLLDERRRAHRTHYTLVGLVLLALVFVAVTAGILVNQRFGPWPQLVSAALLVMSLASFIFGGSETPLSNEGVRRADAWRAYQKHLRRPQDIEPRWGASAGAEARILPVVVALGVAGAWAKYMKKRNAELPAWFRPASEVDGGAALAAFVSHSGAGSFSSAGAGSGAAAGGGSSGAS